MKTKHILNLAFTLACSALAGEKPSSGISVPPSAVAVPNPLSFADGRIVFGIEDQTRFEYRNNNYDFNSGTRTVNDDSWFLNRFRLSLQLKPVDWLTFFVQGQDSREFGSNRANIPNVLGAEGDNPFDIRQAFGSKRIPVRLAR